MTKKQMINLLKTDTKKWNDFIRDNPGLIIDLSNANLEDEDLRAVIFRNVNLENANLINANLISADLSNANLKGADLTFANVSFANLTNADLTGADTTNMRAKCCNISGIKGVRTIKDIYRGALNYDKYSVNESNTRILC